METLNDSSEPKTFSKRRPIYLVVLIVLGAAGFAAWHFGGHHDLAAAQGNPPPTAVTVVTVQQQKQRLWNDFSGRLRAVDFAEIRPEVSGRITEIRFHDGQSVKAGDVLVVIDPRTFEAAEVRAKARIASATANLNFANADNVRNASLIKTKAISQRELDLSDSLHNSSEAELLAAEAELKTAQVDVDHAYVKAPISGRVSRAELTVGNLVQSGPGAPVLTSIVSEGEIYAEFEVDEQTYLETIRNAANGNAQENQIPVRLAIPGSAHEYSGFIQNFDNRLDSSSGTIRARAKFANADRTLVPGMFVSVHLASSLENEIILVPDRAIGFDQSKKFVYVVSSEKKVAYREVELGRELGGQRVVLNGLHSGDRVVVEGLQRVRPEDIVDAEEQKSAMAKVDAKTGEQAHLASTAGHGDQSSKGAQ